MTAAATAFALALALKLLYARIRSREDALQHGHRQRLLALLHERGPLPVGTLAGELGVDRSTIVYHLRVLRRSKTVHVEKHDRTLYAMLPGQPVPARVSHSPSRAAGELLRLLSEAGGSLSRSRLHALAEHVPARARNQAIRDLAEAGAIVRAFAANEEVLSLAPRSGSAA